MGPLTVPMALFLVAGTLAGPVLVALGYADSALAGALAFPVITAVLALAYRMCEPLEAAAHRLRARGNTGAAGLCAVLFGLLPMVALVALQLAAARLLSPASSFLLDCWFYAAATGPATLLAVLAGRHQRTLWSVRAYAGHLGGWIWLAFGGVDAAPQTALLALLPAVLPVGIGALIALADPGVMRASRI